MDGSKAAGLAHQLAGLPGVREALVKAGEGVAYLKVDARSFDEACVIRAARSGEVDSRENTWHQ